MRITNWLSAIARRSRRNNRRRSRLPAQQDCSEVLEQRALLSAVATNLSLSAASTTEGDVTAITVSATADAPVAGPQSVDVDVSGITTADYGLSSVTINIPDGQQEGWVTLTVANDSLVESAETATLSLVNYSPGLHAGTTTSQQLTINDNDTATFTIGDATAAEDGTLSFSVGVSNEIDQDVNIEVSYSGGEASLTDYDSTTDLLTFPANSTQSQTVTVSVTDDNIVEATESFLAAIGVGQASEGLSINVDDGATGTITDNDTATFTLTDSSIKEGDEAASFVITPSNPIDIDVDVKVMVQDGTTSAGDFGLREQTLTFLAGSTEGQMASFAVNDDGVVEATETFAAAVALTDGFDVGDRSLNLTETGGGTLSDNDQATFSIADVQTTEGTADAVFTVELSNPIDTDVTIDVNYLTGTATANDFDQTTDTVTFLAGTTSSRTVTAGIINDGTVELAETFEAGLALDSVIGDRDVLLGEVATATIADDDEAVFAVNDVTVDESISTATLEISLSNPFDIPVSVDVQYGSGSATASTDYDATTDQVTFSAGSNTTQVVTVNFHEDQLVELDEFFYASLALSSEADVGLRNVDLRDVGEIRINDNDMATVSIEDVIVDELAGSAIFTVSLDNPIDRDVDVEVSYGGGTATGDLSDYDSETDTVTFLSETTDSQTVSVDIVDNNIVELLETFTASLNISDATPVGARSVDVSDTAVGQINDDDTAVISISDASNSEDDGVLEFTVSLSNPIDIDSALTLNLTGSSAVPDIDFDATPLSLSFGAGTNEIQTISVPLIDDSAIELPEHLEAALSAQTDFLGRSVTIADPGDGRIMSDDDCSGIEHGTGISFVGRSLLVPGTMEDDNIRVTSTNGTVRVQLNGVTHSFDALLLVTSPSVDLQVGIILI